MNVKKLKKEKSEKEGIKTRLLYKTVGSFEIDRSIGLINCVNLKIVFLYIDIYGGKKLVDILKE